MTITGCSPKKYAKKIGPSYLTMQKSIILDANKRSSPLAAEIVNFGTVKENQVNDVKVRLANLTGETLNLSFDDLTTQLAQQQRFALVDNNCSNVLKQNQTCTLSLTMSYIANEEYNSLITNVITGESNPEFGKLILSGLKNNDITTQYPLANVLSVNTLVDNVMIPFNSQISKRYYISNLDLF